MAKRYIIDTGKRYPFCTRPINLVALVNRSMMAVAIDAMTITEEQVIDVLEYVEWLEEQL